MIKNVKDIVVFWLELTHIDESAKAFKGTVVNSVLPFLQGGSLEIKLTVFDDSF